jgi:hypothetical protein
MNDKTHQSASVIDLVGPIPLALGAVALTAFCVADLLWRILPLTH